MIANLAAPAARAILTRAPAFPAVVRPALTAPALHHALTRQPAPAEAAGVREAVRSARHPAAPAPALLHVLTHQPAPERVLAVPRRAAHHVRRPAVTVMMVTRGALIHQHVQAPAAAEHPSR